MPAAKFLHYQLERCPSTDRLHYQGLIVFENGRSMAAVKALIGGQPSVRIMNGTVEQSIVYCSKNETRVEGPWSGPWSFGERPPGQGKRKDLDVVQKLLDDGEPEEKIARTFFSTWCRNYRAFERYRMLITKPRDWQTDCLVYWGPPGGGKSVHAQELGGSSCYWLARPNSSHGSLWFDGYAGEEVLIIDEFYGWIMRDVLQRVVDRYPLVVQTKNGSCQFVAKRVIITCNVPPRMWYPNVGLGGMKRRLEAPIGFVFYKAVNDHNMFEKEQYLAYLNSGGKADDWKPAVSAPLELYSE